MIAWHYTTGEKLELILEAGLIAPATEGVVAPERPVVWFSINQKFEMTARKGLIANGSRRDATIAEMRELAGGVYRLGIDSLNLIAWRDLPSRAAMRPETVSALKRAARKMGGEPREWLASLESVPIEGLLLQSMADDGTWVRMDGGPGSTVLSADSQGSGADGHAAFM